MSSPLPSGIPIQDLPALAPPPGVRPNFVNPPTYAHTTTAVGAVFIAIMLLAVSVRIYVRARITKIWGWDDVSCIIATCGSMALFVDHEKMIGVGFGRHMWDMRAVSFLDPHKLELLSCNGIVYPVTIFFVKLSILLLYLRIFKVDRPLKLLISWAILVLALFYAAMTGLGIGAVIKCTSFEAGSSRFCKYSARPFSALQQTFNVVTDIYILIIPIPRILKLQLGGKRKLGMILVFTSGLATCAASITRLTQFCINYNNPDLLWVQARNAVYTIVEVNVAIFVACVTCFPAFFAQANVLVDSVLSFLVSNLVAPTRTTYDSQRSNFGNHSILGRKKASGANGAREDMENLKNGRYLELRGVHGFGRLTVTDSGNGDPSLSGEHDTAVAPGYAV